MKLSILIPTIQRHDRLLTLLLTELRAQILNYAGEVEILIDREEYDSVGLKRNRLIDRATGEYLCFFDSDDYPGVNYISQLMAAVDSGYDCASLKGLYSVNGLHDGVFEHSLKYDEWRTVDGPVKYERYPNHLNCIRADIAKRFRFPAINHGEDHDWSKQIHDAGVLRTEYYIDEIIYYYRYVQSKQ